MITKLNRTKAKPGVEVHAGDPNTKEVRSRSGTWTTGDSVSNKYIENVEIWQKQWLFWHGSSNIPQNVMKGKGQKGGYGRMLWGRGGLHCRSNQLAGVGGVGISPSSPTSDWDSSGRDLKISVAHSRAMLSAAPTWLFPGSSCRPSADSPCSDPGPLKLLCRTWAMGTWTVWDLSPFSWAESKFPLSFFYSICNSLGTWRGS